MSFQRFVGNRDGNFVAPATLNFSGGPNQQARVDILTGAAGDFDVGANVLLNLFQTNPGDPLVSGYTLQTTNLTAFLQAHQGETLRLRFAETDNQLFFQFGVDLVNLDVTASVPEPTSIALFGMAMAGAFYGWRRRQQAVAV